MCKLCLNNYGFKRKKKNYSGSSSTKGFCTTGKECDRLEAPKKITLFTVLFSSMSTSIHLGVTQDRPDCASATIATESQWLIIKKFSSFLTPSLFPTWVSEARPRKPSRTQASEVSPAYSWSHEAVSFSVTAAVKVELEHHTDCALPRQGLHAAR